jgi:ubiquinol-cytochrome c reductase cytochrome c1 subunit
MRGVITVSLAALLALSLNGASAAEQGETGAVHEVRIPHQAWSWDGIFGTYDRAALQRGFQVYKDVCSACHSLDLLSYRNLTGIGLTDDQAKKIAEADLITDGPNEEGEMFERPGRLSDSFKAPFPNVQAARAANNGALPPDLSLITKARIGGADYLHALLTGYGDPPAGVTLNDGMSYNQYFPVGQFQIAMPPPLSDGAVTYADGTEATVDQMARDVATFLTWAAEPEMEDRKRTGVKTILFLIVLTGLFYAVKRKVWADVH